MAEAGPASGEPGATAPFLSVVIATLHREQPLRETLRYFLERETYVPFELIVVDQSERHEPVTETLLAEAADRIRYVRTDYRSVTRARNQGVRMARGEVVVFVDDDVEPAAGFLAAHAAPYADLAVAGVAGPVLESGQRLRGRDELPDRLVRRLEAQQEMRFDVDLEFDALWAPTCNLSLRRAVFEQVGGFDENFSGIATIGDDSELCHRVRGTGARIRYSPRAALVHKVVPAGGTRDAVRREAYLDAFVRNTEYFWWKIDGAPRDRLRALWRVYRITALNRATLADGSCVRLTAHFARSLRASRARIRGLARA